jgi:hypothetical protein
MANIIPNPTAGQLSGTIGGLVFARLKNGKVIVRHRPERKTSKKPGEVANQQGFIRAVAYAKAVWASQPELQAKYKAAGQRQGRQGFHLAKADFRLPPRIGDVDLSGYGGNAGDLIRVVATDDFEVKEVLVVLRQLSGELIEQGAAVPEQGTWNYRTQTQVPAGQTVTVEAIAVDYPGHTASKRLDHACGPRSR